MKTKKGYCGYCKHNNNENCIYSATSCDLDTNSMFEVDENILISNSRLDDFSDYNLMAGLDFDQDNTNSDEDYLY